MSVDISKLSRKELDNLQSLIENQKQKLHEEELQKRREAVAAKIVELRKHKDALLSLVSHSRTSCSDENPCNGYGTADYGARCMKCHLIKILNDEWNDEMFDVEFEVRITKVE